MKYIITALLLISIWGCEIRNNEENGKTAFVFDSLKAIKYGADDYGMKSYVFAFLKKGPE